MPGRLLCAGEGMISIGSQKRYLTSFKCVLDSARLGFLHKGIPVNA